MSAALPLRKLLAGLGEVPAGLDPVINGLCSDSRRIKTGELFLALRGKRHHGLDFFSKVCAARPVVVAWEPPYEPLPHDPRVPMVAVEALSQKLPAIAQRFYGTPAEDLQLIGITGTDGKTSCAHFLSQALDDPPWRCGYLGTLGYGFHDELIDTGMTTPDPLQIQAALAGLRDRQARVAAMEVSSHALDQGRVAGLPFAVAVLTNLGRDHLDYHGSLAAYRQAKARLFRECEPAVSVINADDGLGRELLALMEPSRVVSYGLGRVHGPRWIRGHVEALSPAGLQLAVVSSWGEGRLQSPLLGAFNALNLLAVLGTLLALDVPFAEALKRLERIATVPGRMERIQAPDRPLAVVDYAHTPEALRHALASLRAHTRGRLWCVFGCGGDRDPGKRAPMGGIAESHADRIIITNDNPRSEAPEGIATDILKGCQRPQAITVILDRAAAIAEALSQAVPGDVVLIAGKGHENYQLLGDRRTVFSDRDTVRRLWGQG